MCHPGFFNLNEGSPQGLLQQLTLSQVFWTLWGLEEGTSFPDKSELFQFQPGMACITAAHLPPPTPVVHRGPLGLPQLQSTRGVEQDCLWMGKCGKQEYNFRHAGATRTARGGESVSFSLRPGGSQNSCSLLSSIDLFLFILCGALKRNSKGRVLSSVICISGMCQYSLSKSFWIQCFKEMYDKERLKVVMLSIEKIHSTTSRYLGKKTVSVNLKSYIYWTKKEIISCQKSV